MYGLIYSGGEGQNGQRTTLVRIDASPVDHPWHVMRVKDDGTNRCKHGLVVDAEDVLCTFPGLPTKAERKRAVQALNHA